MRLRTRTPSGAPSWPVLLVEGPEKSGRTRACAILSASLRVGRTLWLDLGHGTADEYSAIPGSRYEILVHDGSYAEILGQISAARDTAALAVAAGELPTVLIVNSMTRSWEQIKDWAQQRVRASLENRRRLQADPFAEISLGDAGWTEANARHARIMRLLLTFPGVVVMLAHGKWNTPSTRDGVPDGAPTYRVDGHKGLGGYATCWIRLDRDAPPLIVGSRTPHLDLGGEPILMDRKWSLEEVLFEYLQFAPEQVGTRDLVAARPERVPQQIAAEAARYRTGVARLEELHAEACSLGYEDVTVQSETRRPELLTDMIKRLARARHPDLPSTPQHHEHLAALWRETDDFSDDGARAKFVQEITGREITSPRELTIAEAERVIERLDTYIRQSVPPQTGPDDEPDTSHDNDNDTGAST